MRDRGLDYDVRRYQEDAEMDGLLFPSLIIGVGSLALGLLMGGGLVWLLGLV
jgi:hypothetical protein